MGRFDGVTMVVTWRGLGIGLATARRLLDDGATVCWWAEPQPRLLGATRPPSTDPVCLHVRCGRCHRRGGGGRVLFVGGVWAGSSGVRHRPGVASGGPVHLLPAGGAGPASSPST